MKPTPLTKRRNNYKSQKTFRLIPKHLFTGSIRRRKRTNTKEINMTNMKDGEQAIVMCRNCKTKKHTVYTIPFECLSKTFDITSKCCSSPNYVWYKMWLEDNIGKST